MCGIAGFTGIDQESPRVECSTPWSIVGLTASAVEVNEHFSMGMRRLAIVDIEGGNQPIYTDDHRLALIYNGEIYNAPELRVELEAKGIASPPTTPTPR